MLQMFCIFKVTGTEEPHETLQTTNRYTFRDASPITPNYKFQFKDCCFEWKHTVFPERYELHFDV